MKTCKWILLIVGALLLVSLLISCVNVKKPVVTTLNNDVVKVIVVSTYEVNGGTNFIIKHDLTFRPKKVGKYSVTAWRAIYRDQDQLDKTVNVDVPSVPCVEEMLFDPKVYRIEIVFSDSNGIQQFRMNVPFHP